MDPLVDGYPGCLNFQMSRIHREAARIGHFPSNRSKPLARQIEDIKTRLTTFSDRHKTQKMRIACLDDDYFSGETMNTAKEHFAQCGLSVEIFAAGIKVGTGEKFANQNITVLGAVDYSHLRGALDIDVIDLRDFVLGYDGMGVFLPRSQCMGRVPCFIPFFQPSRDTLIPRKAERQFSMDMWKANRVHFSTLQERLGVHVKLSHMHPEAALYMREAGFPARMPMLELVESIYNGL